MPQTRIQANGTDQIWNGQGNINRVVIGTKGASSNTMTIWDASNAEPGYILVKIDTTANVGSIEFNLAVRNGIKVVTATGTAPDALVVYNENR